MAGAATCTVGDSRVRIACGIDMATQAAAAEHIVSQCQRRCKRGGDRNVWGGCQGRLSTKMRSDRVDFFAKGEMQGMGRIRYLLGMACAAGRCHVCRVSGLSYQVGVSFIDLPFIIETAMAGYAGQIVGRIELDLFMAA